MTQFSKLKNLLFCIIFLSGFLVCQNAQADTHTASSCSVSDVSSAISASETGDTVSIPAGECTWVSGITIPDEKKIILQGAGSANTIITFDTTFTLLKMGLQGGDITGTRITNMGFIQTATSQNYAVIEARGSGWRIDHNEFENTSGSSAYTIMANGTNVTVTPKGLIDQNNFIQSRIDVGGMGTFEKNSIMWTNPSALGTADAVFIEDNNFYKTVAISGGNVVDCNRAGFYVARYNTVTGSQFMVHGLQADNERAPKNWEIYGNEHTHTSSEGTGALFINGGTGIIFGNTQSGYHNAEIKFSQVRSYTSVGVFGLCDGSMYSDGNLDATGWPCRDQIGRGPDASLWNPNTENPSPIQETQPVYVFLNRNETGISNIYNTDTDHIQANRDYFVEGATFDGTSGVGCGTLANMPATCTYNETTGTGVGYWATNQSCSDFTEFIGVDHTSNFEGTLYRCTADNTWTEYYTPYTYPHPLREASDIVAPASPTGLAVS